MLAACEFDLAAPREIVVAGKPGLEMMHELWNSFDPNRVLLYAGAEIGKYQPAAAAFAGDRPAVSLCENFACQTPAFNAEDLARLLK